MPESLALTAAVCFGLVHFFSGVLSRRASSYAIAVVGQAGGTLLVLVAALLVADPHVSPASLGWGALSGVGTGLGVAFLYRGMATGRMSVVVPLSDVAAVALPVLLGVVVLGDRPALLAWGGILVSLPALWLVSRGASPGSMVAATGTQEGLIAGVGFALQFIAISRVDPASGLWPVLAARLAATLTIVPLALRAGAILRLPHRLIAPALVVGALGSVGIVLYLAATRQQLLSLATVLSALYPAIPVVLAVLVLRERLSTAQTLGLCCTAAAIALITLG